MSIEEPIADHIGGSERLREPGAGAPFVIAWDGLAYDERAGAVWQARYLIGPRAPW